MNEGSSAEAEFGEELMAEINDALVRRRRRFLIIVGAAVLATIVGVALLMNIFERKQEARIRFIAWSS
jgi:hypothetical protein